MCPFSDHPPAKPYALYYSLVGDRVEHMKMFADDHFFAADGLLNVRHQGNREPTVCGSLDVN